MIMFLTPVLFLLFTSCNGVEQSGTETGGQTLNMPLLNNLQGPILVQIGVDELNKQLKDFIEQEVTKGVKTAMENLASSVINEKLEEITPKLQKGFETKFEEIKDNIGVTYTQWGRTTCTAANTEVVYSGFVGGSAYNSPGSAVNHLCLTTDPDWDVYDNKANNNPIITGALYNVHDINVPNSPFEFNKYHNHRVPCSVCRKKQLTTTIMIPARRECYGNWTIEYEGYLYSGHHTHQAATEYICLDKTPETLSKAPTSTNIKLLYPVRVYCNEAIPCPPYVDGREVTCVVCSK